MPPSASAEMVYPTEGRAKLPAGTHRLQPGNISLSVAGNIPSSKHPAIKVVDSAAGPEVLILCAGRFVWRSSILRGGRCPRGCASSAANVRC